MAVEKSSILFLKTAHSLIWAVMASAIFYILYSGISGDINSITYLCIGLLFVEVAVLLLNNWVCPFTNMAKESKHDWKDGDDIFLPKWLAIHNKEIFGTLFILGLALVLFRVAGL